MPASQYKSIPRFREPALIGSWSGFSKDRLGLLQRVARECGEIGEFRVGPMSLYLVNGVKMLQEVLVDKASHMTPEPFARSFYPVTGRTALPGIAGDYHLRMRRIMAPAFSHKRLVSYTVQMAQVADEYQRDLKDGAEVDVNKLMHGLSRDIIARCVFLVDSREDERFFECVRVAAEFIGNGAANPLQLPLSVPTPSNRRTLAAIEHMRRRTQQLLALARERGDKGDVISMLLLARDTDGTGLNEEELRDQTLIVYLAGHETSSNSLSFFTFMLAQHPDVQARVQAEVDQVLGGRPPTYEDLARLPYTLQALKETLRLYNPAAIFGRAPMQDMEVGGYWMRKGQYLMISPYVHHRNEQFFPDPERYDPDRFLPENEKKLPRGAYLPFGNGPHVCIGNHFAMMEMHLVMAHLCQHVEFSFSRPQVLRPLPLATLTPAPFSVRVRRRKASIALAS